jgi:hypothetical protein
MKNATITFSEEDVNHLMQSFQDNNERLSRLSSPLVSLSLDEN